MIAEWIAAAAAGYTGFRLLRKDLRGVGDKTREVERREREDYVRLVYLAMRNAPPEKRLEIFELMMMGRPR